MGSRTASIRRSLTAAIAVSSLVASAPPRASAQGVRVLQAPMNSNGTQAMSPSGHRYDYCPGRYGKSTPPAPPPFPIPLEWEVLIENDTDSAETFAFDENVQSGMNGNYFTLNCPPTLLPASVNPATDVTCTASSNHIQIRNIVIPACSRERLRFTVNSDTSMPQRIDACAGGNVTWGASNSTTTMTPLTDQTPKDGNNTCVYFDDFCMPPVIRDVAMVYTMVDENGPPLLPGDTVVFKAMVDFRYFDNLPPPPDVYFEHWDANTDGAYNSTPLPQYIDFIEFTPTGKPFEAAGIIYEYLPGTRTLHAYDPDPNCPGTCTKAMALATPNWTEIVEWRGRVNCSAPIAPAPGQCAYPNLAVGSSWGTSMNISSNDPTTYTDSNDSTCASPTQPDLSTSTKTVSDSDKSGDAQPGELLTFSVNAINSMTCPSSNMTCECAATSVVVTDVVSGTYLDINSINPLNGGQIVVPGTVKWTIPIVHASGTAGSTQTVQFQARVKTSGVKNGDMICNTATIQAAELTAVSDGGRSNCATKPPVSVSVSPCIAVKIPPGPSLSIAKTVAPATGPYEVGTKVTYSITVTNVGGGPATNVVVTDSLDNAWCKNAPGPACPALSNISDAGTYALNKITWPALATLAAGASKTYTFDATIPKDLPDKTVVPNTADTKSTEIPSAVPSNQLNLPTCAPVLVFNKTSDKSAYQEGDTATFTLTVSNSGSCDASNVVISDPVDVVRLDETTLVWNPPTGTWNSGTKTYTWPAVATLAANSTQTLNYTLAGKIRTGTAGTQICNTGQAAWDQGLLPQSSTPTTGTCADISKGTPTCQPPGLGKITLVKGVKQAANAVFTWPALATPPPEYHLNSVASKTDVPPASPCSATTGSNRASCGIGVARDTQTTPTGTHTNAITDPTALLFYQVYAACGGTGDLEGPF